LCGCSKQIDGQIFVSTQGGMSYKLGSVPVSIVKANDLTPVLKRYISDAQTLKVNGVASIKKIADVVKSAEVKSNTTEKDLNTLKEYVIMAASEEAIKQIERKNWVINKIMSLLLSILLTLKIFLFVAMFIASLVALFISSNYSLDAGPGEWRKVCVFPIMLFLICLVWVFFCNNTTPETYFSFPVNTPTQTQQLENNK